MYSPPAYRLLALVAALATIGAFATTPTATVTAAETAKTDLQKDLETIEAGKAKVTDLRAQVDASGKAIEQERASLQVLETEVQQLREETEKLKKAVGMGGSAHKYNEAAAAYNTKAQATIDRRNTLETSIANHNQLVRELREQAKVVNDLVIAYNEKLARKAN